LTRFSAEHAAEIYAFDPTASAYAPQRSFAVHDGAALDVERRRFDLALCGWSL
jgi:hypothetical protein